MSRFAKFAANIRFNLYGQIVQAALPLFFVPFVIRHLGQEAYGLYVLIAVLTSQLNLVNFGAGPATVKYLAEFDATGDRARVDRLIGNSFVFYGGTGVLGLAALAAAAPLLSRRVFHISAALEPAARFVFFCSAGVFLLQSIARTLHAVPQALQRFDWWNGLETASTLVSYSGIYVLLSLGFWIRALSAWSVAVAALNLALYAAVCGRLLPGRAWRPSYDAEMMRKVTRFGGLAFVGQVLWSVSHQIDKVVLGHYLPLAEVTYYLVAFSLAQKLPMLIGPMLPVLLPFSSTLHGRRDYDAARRLYVSGTKLIMIVTWPAALLGVFFAPAFLGLWLGGQFSLNAGWVLRLLIAGTFIELPTAVGTLIGQGFEWIPTQVAIAAVCTAAEVLCWPFVLPRWGSAAAAWVYLGGASLQSALLLRFYNRKLLPERSGEFWRTLSLPTAVSIPLLAASALLRNSLKSWLDLGAFGALGYGATVALSYFLAFDEEERCRVGQFLDARLRMVR